MQFSASNPVPSVPGGVTLNPYYDGIELVFDRPTDPDFAGVKVYVDTTSGFTPSAANLKYDGPHSKPLFIDGLLQSTTYYVKFVLCDIFGDSSVSSQYSTTTLAVPEGDTAAPTVPNAGTAPTVTSIVRESKLYATGELTVSWSASTDNSGRLFYRVEFWTDPAKKTVVETDDLSYTIFPAQIGIQYSVRVQAVDYSAGNESAFTPATNHTITGDAAAPANVTAPSATAGLDKVTVEWTNPTDADFIETQVYRGTSDLFTPDDLTNLVYRGRADSFVDTQVANGTAYYYKFKTRDVGGNVTGASGATGPATPFKISAANVGTYFDSAAIGDAYISNLDAAKITTGFLSADRIDAGAITASKINVSQLSAIAADLGTITAGTIIGAIILTGSVNPRVALDSTNGISAFNASSVQTVAIRPDGSGYMGSSGAFSWTTAGVLTISAANVSGTLTAVTFRTSAGNPKVEIDSTNGIRALNAGGAVTAQILTDGSGFLGAGTERVSWDTAGALTVNTLRTAASGQRMEIRATDNEMHFYGNRGDGTVEELATIGINSGVQDDVIGLFGSSTSTRAAINALGKSKYLVEAVSGSTDTAAAALRGESTAAGVGVSGKGYRTGIEAMNGLDGFLRAQPTSSNLPPTSTPADTTKAHVAVNGLGEFYGRGAGANAAWGLLKGPAAWVNFNGAQKTGTYSRSGTTITVTIAAHGLITGDRVQLDFTTGTATDGSYIATVTASNTFTVTDTVSGATSGNVTLQTHIRDSFNVIGVTDFGTGLYEVAFDQDFPNLNYAFCPGVSGESVQSRIVYHEGTMSTSAFRMRIFAINVGAVDSGIVAASFFASARSTSISPYTQSFAGTGAGTTTVPYGAASVTFKLTGCGGKGAEDNAGGGGGGGAGYCERTVAVTPADWGKTITYDAPIANVSGAGENATLSVNLVNNNTSMQANGGAAGVASTGGAGGTATGGTTNTTGATGVNGNTVIQNGGGNGGVGAGPSGGVAGLGGTSGNNGTSGGLPGGGGGGGGGNAATGTRGTGGNGGAALVQMDWS